jgi:hypothetical protein
MQKTAWCRAAVWLLVATLVMWGGAARAFAQVGATIKGEIVSVGIGGVQGNGGLYRVGSWVPVRVRLENRSGKPVVGRLGVEQPDLDGDKAVSVGAKFILQPSAEPRDFWLYYWPRPDDDGTAVHQVVVLDETGQQVMGTIGMPSIKSSGVGIMPRDMKNNRSSRWVVVLGPKAAGMETFIDAMGGVEGVRFSVLPNANDLPDNVLGLDGVDAVIWEADWVKPSDVAPEFQMKALLDWVQAGGHLIITAGRQGEEFLKAGRLRDAMPMTFTGTREVDLKELRALTWVGDEFKGKEGKLTQLTGTLRPGPNGSPGARAISGGGVQGFAEHPLAVTGPYGAGAVTVLTVDAASPEMLQGLRDEGAMNFWSQIAGWQPGDAMTRAHVDEALKDVPLGGPAKAKINTDAQEVWLGKWISTKIDVTEVTQVRVLVAVLFLAVYWLAAGPIGYVVLRAYGVVHWSWWVFGGAVIVASGLAAGVVTLLHLTNYDLRHKTVVLGMVNSKQVAAVGFYGIFAPASGALSVEQPNTGGMNYLAPLCEPTEAPVQPFADPQTYYLSDEKPWSPSPVFRNTLKKMQGRWTGELPGIEGKAELPGLAVVRGSPLRGELVNHSGYELENVEIVVYQPSPGGMGNSYLYKLKTGAKGEVWADGAKLDLATMVAPEASRGADTPDMLELQVLQPLAHNWITGSSVMRGMGGFGPGDEEAKMVKGRGDDLLHVLLDARPPEVLSDSSRVEMVRGLTRNMDATKLLHATGCLIIARAGDISNKRYVPSPVPITVSGRKVTGKGDVLFVWGLPVASKTAEAPLGAEGGAENDAGNAGLRPGLRGRLNGGRGRGGAGAGGAVGPE